MRFGSDSGEKRGTTVDGLGVCARRQAGGTSLGPRSGHSGCVSFSHAKMHAQSRFLPLAHESESVQGLEVQDASEAVSLLGWTLNDDAR